jgi:hypothetical protein
LGWGFVPELGFTLPSAKAVVIRAPAGAPLRRRIFAFTRSAFATTPGWKSLLAELQ